MDRRVENLAAVITDYSVRIDEEMEVIIMGHYSAQPLIEAIMKRVVEKGAHPILSVYTDNSEFIFYKYAKENLLTSIPKYRRFLYENADVFINIESTVNTRALTNVDHERVQRRMAANAPLIEIFQEREKRGELQWVIAPYPTLGLAQEAEMSLLEYEEFVYAACMANREDAVERWRELEEMQRKVTGYLEGKSEIRIVGEDTDITFRVDGRKWVNSAGHKNLPDGEVFTSPLEDSAEGHIRFTYPAIYRGVEVRDIFLRFENGEVVEYGATRGKEFLEKMLNVDEGAKRVGEVAIGTNYAIDRFTRNILFDEKIGGTVHIALGRGFPAETGGGNVSSLHWDMIKDMRGGGRIYADGELFYENGKFLIL